LAEGQTEEGKGEEERREVKMAVYKRGDMWWYEFIFAGKRVRESAKTSRKTIALESERQRRMQLERTLEGMPIEKLGNRIKSVTELVKAYAQAYPVNHRPSAAAYVRSCAKNLERQLGMVLLPDLSEDRVRGYMVA
jgi:hypothetical protein